MRFDTKETAEFPLTFPISVLISQFFDTSVKTFQGIGKLIVSQKVLNKDLFIVSFWFKALQSAEMSSCPMAGAGIVNKAMAEAERGDLLLDLLECQFMVIPHADELLDPLLFGGRNMYLVIRMMSEAASDHLRIPLIGLFLFLYRRFRHSGRSEYDSFNTMIVHLMI